MKLHFSSSTSILTANPSIVAPLYNSLLIHYVSPYVYVSDTSTNKVLCKFTHTDVQALSVHGNRLYVFTNEIFIYDLDTLRMASLVALSKPLISSAKIYSDGSDGISILVSKLNNRVYLIRDGNIVSDVPSGSRVSHLLLSGTVYGFVDKDRLVAYNQYGKMIEKEVEDVLYAFVSGESVFTLDGSSILKEWNTGREMCLVDGITYAFYDGEHLHCASGYSVYLYTAEGRLVSTIDMSHLMDGFPPTPTCSLPRREHPEAGRRSSSSDDSSSYSLGSDIEQLIDNGEEIYKRLRSNLRAAQTEGNSNSEGSVDMDNMDDFIELQDAKGYADPEASYSDNIAEDPLFSYIDRSIIHMGNYVIFHDQFEKISKMYAFNSDITEVARYEEYMLFSTLSGHIRYTRADRYSEEGEFLCEVNFCNVAGDTITGMAVSGDRLVVGSVNKTLLYLHITRRAPDALSFDYVITLASSLEPITAVALSPRLIAFASSDCLLQIYEMGGPDEMPGEGECLTAKLKGETIRFRPITIQKLHSKEIVHISITPDCLITSSCDKTVKFIDTSSGEVLKTIEPGSAVVHTSVSDKYIAVCASKSIELLTRALSPVSSIQLKRPVTSSLFYREYFITISDILRIYDVSAGKCVKSYDFGLTNCWSHSFPFLCAENKILLLSDQSEEVATELLKELQSLKEDALLTEKYCREGKYSEVLEIFSRKNDYTRMFQTVCLGYHKSGNLDFLSILSGSRSKITDMLLKCSGYKHADVFSLVVQRELPFVSDKARKKRILDILRKHAVGIESVYEELLGTEQE